MLSLYSKDTETHTHGDTNTNEPTN